MQPPTLAKRLQLTGCPHSCAPQAALVVVKAGWSSLASLAGLSIPKHLTAMVAGEVLALTIYFQGEEL